MPKDVGFDNLNIEVSDINASRPTVKFTTDKNFAAQVTQHMKPYKNIPALFKPALEQTADYIRDTMITRVFDKEGPGWRPLAPRTVSERIAAGFGGKHPILKRTGDLFESLTDRSHPQHVEILKTGKNSRVEIGSVSKKFVDNQRGNPGMHLPARPMLPGTGNVPFPEGDRIEIQRIFNRVKEQHRR